MLGFIFFTLRSAPARDPLERRHEWAKLAAMAGLWALLIGTGLGNVSLLVVGALCFAVAGFFALTAGAGGFAAVALLLAIVGVSPYLFLYIRSGQHPIVNEAAPATWDALLAVIRRAQYPPRGPLDDPTVAHGAGQPGRSLTIIWLQLANYLLYWVWQFGKTTLGTIGGLPLLQAVVFALFAGLGVRGSLAQRRNDRGAWWLLLLLWLVTGAGLVAYMNFKPGFSVGYPEFPDGNLHEVRERDYFFVVSFVVWGLWAGMGLVVAGEAGGRQGGRAKGSSVPLAAALFLVALVPPVLNWREASRSYAADRTLAADLAYNLLNSVPPYGILFTYGDNDTFPLWWAQEVAGIRQDVTVVCLALAQTDWYMRQLRDNPVRDFNEAAAPKVWQGLNPVKPTWALHSMTDAEVAGRIDLADPDRLHHGTADRSHRGHAQGTDGPLPERHREPADHPAESRASRDHLVPHDRRQLRGTARLRHPAGDGLPPVDRRCRTRPSPGSAWAASGTWRWTFPSPSAWPGRPTSTAPCSSGTTDRLESTAASMASSLSIPFTILAYHADAVGDTSGGGEEPRTRRADRPQRGNPVGPHGLQVPPPQSRSNPLNSKVMAAHNLVDRLAVVRETIDRSLTRAGRRHSVAHRRGHEDASRRCGARGARGRPGRCRREPGAGGDREAGCASGRGTCAGTSSARCSEARRGWCRAASR